MQAGDIPADALSDLRTQDNKLSVWSVEADKTNLNVVLTAFASTRQRVDKLDYTLVDESVLPRILIDAAQSDASTPYVSANAAHWDLVELTVSKIVRLAQEVMLLDRVRVSERQVRALLMEALQTGALDRARMIPDLLAELEAASTQT